MKKKGVENNCFKCRLTSYVFIIFILILNVFLLNAQTPQPTNEEEQWKKLAEDTGKDINKFLELKPDIRKNILENSNYLDSFILGLQSNNDNFNKFLDTWFEKQDNKFTFSDEEKNILFKELLKKDKDFAKKLVQKIVEKLRAKDERAKELYKSNIEDFIIDENILDKLIWEGNKLVLKDEKGGIKAFLDFDSLPAFLKKIKIKKEDNVEKFFLEFKKGNKDMSIVFDKGGIDSQLYVLRPDGRRFGSVPYLIDSITRDENKINIGYYDYKGDIQTIGFERDNEGLLLSFKDSNDKLQTIKIPKGTKSENFDSKLNKLFKEKFGYDLDVDGLKSIYEQGKKFFDELEKIPKNDKTAPELEQIKNNAQELLATIGKRGYKAPTANLVNLEFFDKEATAPKSEFTFNEKGELNLKLLGGAYSVSTNTKGGAGLMLRQNSLTKDKQAEISYNKHGELISIKNAEGKLYDREGLETIFFKAGEETLKTTIVRSSLADALLRGDTSKLVSSLEHQSNLVKSVLLTQNPQDIAKSITALQDIIGNENFDVAVRNKAIDLKDILEESLIERMNEVVSQIFTQQEREKNPQLGDTTEIVLEQTKNALKKLTTPENINIIADYLANPTNEDPLNQLIQQTLNTYVDEYKSLLSSSMADVVFKQIQQLGKDSNREQVETAIQEWVNSADFVEKVKGFTAGNSQQELPQKLQEILGTLPSDEKEKILEVFKDLVKPISSSLSEQSKQAFFNSVKTKIKEMNIKDGNHLLIDDDTGEIIYSGNADVLVNAKVALRKVSVKDNAEDDKKFELKSFGTVVATFNGDKTNVPRTIGNSRVVNIGTMTNENKQGDTLKVISDHNTYRIIDPKNPEQVKSVINQYGWVFRDSGIKLIGTVPVLTHHIDLTRNLDIEDSGLDPNAEFTLTVIGQSQYYKGGLFGRVISRVVNRVAQGIIEEAFGKIDLSVIKKDANQQIDEFMKPFEGYRGVVREGATTTREFLQYAEKNKLFEGDMPRRQAVEDAVTLLEMYGEPNNQGIKTTLSPIIDWISQQRINRYTEIKVTSNSIKIGNQEYKAKTPREQALLRQAMREIVVFQDRISEGLRRAIQQKVSKAQR